MKWDILAVIVPLVVFLPPLYPCFQTSQRNPLTNRKKKSVWSIFVVQVVRIFPKIAGKTQVKKFFPQIRRVYKMYNKAWTHVVVGTELIHNQFLFWFQRKTLPSYRSPISCTQADFMKSETSAQRKREKEKRLGGGGG